MCNYYCQPDCQALRNETDNNNTRRLCSQSDRPVARAERVAVCCFQPRKL